MAGASAAGARKPARTKMLGTVRFCRISDRSLRDAALAIVGRDIVVEVDSSTSGLTLLGSRATLVLDHNGWRLFAPAAV